MGSKFTECKLLGGVLFCVAAYMGNVLNVDLFFGVNFLFGSIFVWLALMTVGPVWAVAAAAIGAFYTVELWGHWYAAFIFTSEAIAVSLVLRRVRCTGIAFSVLLYWLIFGAPCSILAYYQGLNLPWATVFLVVVKQVLNSLVNVSVAVLVFNIALLLFPNATNTDKENAPSSYSNLLQALFGLLMLIPISISEFHELDQSFKDQTKGLQERSRANVERSALSAVSFLKLETTFWGQFLQEVEFSSERTQLILEKGRKTSVFPALIYEFSSKEDWHWVFGNPGFDPSPLTNDLRKYSIVGPSGSHILGCWSGMIFTVSDTPRTPELRVFGWRPSDLEMLVSQEPGVNIEIRCHSPNAELENTGKPAVVEVVRDRSLGMPSLISWQRGYVKSRAPLEAVHASCLELTVPLESIVIAIQADTAKAVFRLCILAILIVSGGVFLELYFRRWIENFVMSAETLLRFRRPPPGRVNSNFHEQREISKWFRRFAVAVESEERSKILAVENFEKLVKQTSAPIFATDADGLIAEWNPPLEQMTGYARDEVMGTPLSDLAANSLEIQSSQRGHGEALFHVEIRSKRGTLVYFEASQTLLTELSDIGLTYHDQTSSSVGVVKFFMARNVNELKDAQAKLIQASRLAALGEMASSFAHELNQPLNIISMSAGNYLERVKFEDVPSTYVVSKMQRIEQQALRAGRVIQGIRHFVLKIGGEEVVPFDPVERIRAAIALLQEQLRLDSVEVELNTPDTSHCIIGRPLMFEQTLLNLLTNARQAMDETPRELKRIRIDVEKDDGVLLVSVADSGPGIPSELLERVFDPFFSTKNEATGTGIGLYLCRTMVEAMHGSIHAKTSLDGALIVMRFPVASGKCDTLNDKEVSS